MQRGTFYGGTRQQYGFEVGDGGNGTCTPYLITYRIQSCQSPLGLVFVRNSPAWRFGCKSEISLLSQVVDFEYYAVGGYGQVASLRIPVAYEVEYLVEATATAYGVRYLEAPRFCRHHIVVVCLCGQVFGHLKDEFFRGQDWQTFESFKADLDAYITHWNTTRRQVKLKGLTPAEYRDQALQEAA